MEKNVGGLDKMARILVGVCLIAATVAGFLPVWGYIGIVPLVTGLVGWCPLYRIVGLNSCPMKQ
jgi:hypothetical protein